MLESAKSVQITANRDTSWESEKVEFPEADDPIILL